MNLQDLKELREERFELLMYGSKYKSNDEKARKLVAAGVDSTRQDVDALDAMIDHVEEMMSQVSGTTASRDEIERLLILTIDLWDAPF